MYINVNPFDSDVAELEQSDIESMWNYLMEEPDNFIYTATHVFNFYFNTEQDEALAQTFANFMCEYLATKRVQ